MELLHKLMTAPIEFFEGYGLPFIVVLSVLVFVHEWGHYIIARLCGVKIESFSIGFGKELFGRTDKRGTRWKFSMIPLGGYVQMFGDVDPASASHAAGVVQDAGAAGESAVRDFTPAERKVAFFAQPVGRRAAIVFAGPAINFIFAILILATLYTVQGKPFVPAVAAKVVEGSAADKAGIKPDDKIISINGETITRFQDLKAMTAVNLDSQMDITLVHYLGDGKWSDETHSVSLRPTLLVEADRFGFKHSEGRIGIISPDAATEMQHYSPISAIVAATGETWSISVNTLKAIGQMIMGTRSADELGGILRIGAYAGEFAKGGFVSLVTFAALLSVNLGLINLLPIPMLDGGHLAFYAMETVRGKPVTEKIQEYALRLGMAFLLCIMVFATWNDLVQLKVVDYVIHLVS